MAVLTAYRQHVEAKNWQDERLRAMVLQAVALHALGEKDKAVHVLRGALVLAEPEGFIRIFVDEGRPMAQPLSEASAQGIMPDYAARLLAVFESEKQASEDKSDQPLSTHHRAIDPTRAGSTTAHRPGTSNREIANVSSSPRQRERHNRRILKTAGQRRKAMACSRAGSVVAKTSVYQQTRFQELPASAP
jgi:LuxR family maltose regulon positive regulatory protein